MILEHIEGPADLKKCSVEELKKLSGEVRQAILKRLSDHGGHIGPNLGMVEATVALHYVFDSPTDKVVFDVSHQCYAHKVLTGRKNGFLNPEEYDTVSGYTNPDESPHDFFKVGHTSTSISLACGLAKARDLKGEKSNIIAVIGDGSLSGGEALEGLDNAGEMTSNLIIVFNDNQMSIAENHGGMYRNLKELRESNGNCPCNLFRAMGLDYRYVADGNDVQALIAAFAEVKDFDHPVIVHINTVKGKGYSFAEKDKEIWHWGGPFDLSTGNSTVDFGTAEDYSDLTAEYLLAEMKKDPTLVAITAATPTVLGFTPERRREAGRQFVDVGIAEEHAVALASGIAAGGGKPVWGVYSTFIQRTYDQLSQDLCINRNPAVVLVFGGSLNGFNDVTHLGFFDIPVLSNIPNMVYLAPSCREEYFAMLDWGIRQTTHPVAIRVPANGVISSGKAVTADYSELNRYEITCSGSDVAILALGSFYQLGEKVAELLNAETGIAPTLVNPRFITGLDRALLEKLKKHHRLVVTLEDGVLDGGFGEKIARYYGPDRMKVLNCGAPKAFADRFDPAEFLKKCRLTAPQIVEDIDTILKLK